MNSIFVAGLGAVSPAGWDVAALRTALDQGRPLPLQSLVRPGTDQSLPARLVTNPLTRPAFLAHPRLRRSSPVTHYAVAAALEALSGLRAAAGASKPRLGVIVSLQSGCVQYSTRFYGETLKNPATASPLIFPETVYAAPASHVAALLENVVLAYSLVGDPAAFLQAVAIGSEWLAEQRVDACLVIGAEETHWIIADALRLLDRQTVLAAGAGALCLCREPIGSAVVELSAITDAHTITARQPKAQAAQAMRQQLGQNPAASLLVEGTGVSPRSDEAERAAWQGWSGARVRPKQILGEGMMAAAAWQCVAACDAIGSGKFTAVDVSLVGSNQAIGARFIRGPSRISDLSNAASAGTMPA
jgi:3-oxoacyl-(acyl-carrier-protein) synthase